MEYNFAKLGEYFKDHQKVPVQEFTNNVPEKPLVSVCVQTYQHVDYIADCLEGILMQKTTFPFEILVGEDASTDGTREICKRYARKYPHKIRLFLHSRENNITINGTPSGRFNALYNTYQARGEYIAKCEGDDYWVDPYKIQKQVDYLRKDPELALVYTSFIEYNKKTGKWNRNPYKNLSAGIMEGRIFHELVKGSWIATVTVMIRRKDLAQYVDYMEILSGEYPMADMPAWLELAYHKKIGYINETTAVRRLLQNSASQFTKIKKRAEFIEKGHQIRKNILRKHTTDQDIDNQLDIKINRRRIRYTFFTNEPAIMEQAKNHLEELGYSLSFSEKIYYYTFQVKFLRSPFRKLLKLFRVKV